MTQTNVYKKIIEQHEQDIDSLAKLISDSINDSPVFKKHKYNVKFIPEGEPIPIDEGDV